MVKYVDDNNFKVEVIETSNEKPVLVDFYAEWCGPCRMMAPIIDEIAHEIKEKAVLSKLDTDQAPATANQYNIMSIPNILIFRNGQIVENYIGVQSKETLIDGLMKHR